MSLPVEDAIRKRLVVEPVLPAIVRRAVGEEEPMPIEPSCLIASCVVPPFLSSIKREVVDENFPPSFPASMESIVPSKSSVS